MVMLSDSARSAAEAAQVASSIVFKLPDEKPLLVIISGRYEVDTELIAASSVSKNFFEPMPISFVNGLGSRLGRALYGFYNK